MRKILLQADVKALGQVGDVVNVSDGYARNYLLPQGMGIEPTPKNIAKMEEEKKLIAARRAQELAEKRKMADRLNGVEITLVSTANEQGILFGSIGQKEISDALREEGYNLEPKNVILAEHLKQLGKFAVSLELAPEVTSSISVWVTPSKDSAVQLSTETKKEAGAEADGSHE
jgi:large subunit ribosomal protein L9